MKSWTVPRRISSCFLIILPKTLSFPPYNRVFPQFWWKIVFKAGGVMIFQTNINRAGWMIEVHSHKEGRVTTTYFSGTNTNLSEAF